LGSLYIENSEGHLAHGYGRNLRFTWKNSPQLNLKSGGGGGGWVLNGLRKSGVFFQRSGDRGEGEFTRIPGITFRQGGWARTRKRGKGLIGSGRYNEVRGTKGKGGRESPPAQQGSTLRDRRRGAVSGLNKSQSFLCTWRNTLPRRKFGLSRDRKGIGIERLGKVKASL